MQNSKSKTPGIIIISFTVCAVLSLFFISPIPQNLSYHHFADSRTILNIPNFYNVISNLPFLILGIMGIYIGRRKHKAMRKLPVAYFTLCIGVAGIGLGSAYYHLVPSNASLVWDRIPMTITFMSYLSIVLSNYVDKKLGRLLLFPLLALGVISVLSWYVGDTKGEGDLRLYALVQFYPMILIPLFLFLYPTPKVVRVEILAVIFLYGIAKFFEAQDASVYEVTAIMSGHSIKHLFAAGAVLLILLTLRREPNFSKE